jgi:hypothetical protein
LLRRPSADRKTASVKHRFSPSKHTDQRDAVFSTSRPGVMVCRASRVAIWRFARSVPVIGSNRCLNSFVCKNTVFRCRVADPIAPERPRFPPSSAECVGTGLRFLRRDRRVYEIAEISLTDTLDMGMTFRAAGWPVVPRQHRCGPRRAAGANPSLRSHDLGDLCAKGGLQTGTGGSSCTRTRAVSR